jgi:hypothetical protein
MNHNESLAIKEANEGHVCGLLRQIRSETDTGSKYRMLGLLPMAVKAAAINGRVTDSIEVLGARGISLHYQMVALQVLVESGKEDWLAGALGTKEIPEAIGIRIVKALADAGQISAILRIAEGKKEVPDAVRNKAKERVATAYLEASPEKRGKLTKDELLGITDLLARRYNPVAGDGMLLKGNGNMRPRAENARGRSLKR